MGSCGSSSKQGAGSAAKQSPIKYLSSDNALYESPDEVLYVSREVGTISMGFYETDDVLEAQSDRKGNITLSYAKPDEYFEKNKKHKYGLYELKTGITSASDIESSILHDPNYGYVKEAKSKFKVENQAGYVRSVGIDWDKVNSVSGKTYNVKALLREKGFRWDGADKSWKK